MKTIKSTFVLLLITSLSFISCNDEPLEGNFADELNIDNAGGGGAGAGSGTSTGDYFPRAVGNQWELSISTGGTQSLNMVSTSQHNSITYYDFSSSVGYGSIRKSAASYFNRIAVSIDNPAYIIESTPFEIKFLQDDAVVGTSWDNVVSSTYSYTPIGDSPAIPNTTVSMNYKYTLLGRDLTRNVNGQTYNNVIHISHVLETLGEGGSLGDTGDIEGDYYYSKDIGLIEYSIDGVTYKLNSYTLN
ncbi:hypothetical protein [Pseudofulvibacter geojedonensis]|uniref:Lipoprotein n=1 Tax=Pseudofulvibacter geojedonensis TaxID=1123758 RepID=A0ABW3HY54_9FLAO